MEVYMLNSDPHQQKGGSVSTSGIGGKDQWISKCPLVTRDDLQAS